MKIAFYLFILPLSKLPISILYGISNAMCFLLQYVFHYRNQVIFDNLSRSFPEKTEKEINRIKATYYRHLSDLLIEGIKLLSLSRKEVMKRYVCDQPELLEPYFQRGESVILVSAHVNNWEYMVLSIDMQFPHHGIGVGKPLSNQWFDKVLNNYRQRYGSEVVFASNVRESFQNNQQNQQATAYMMLFDQSPGDPKKCYWTPFLHQETGFLYGPEYFAKKYNYPVFYYAVRKEKRGYYRFSISPISEKPLEESYGAITARCVDRLEAEILKYPESWLWSHKRWKHPRPKDQCLHPRLHTL